MKHKISGYITVYRLVAAAGFLTVVVLALILPVRMIGASPWAYYYGVQNFAQGKLVIDDQLHSEQVQDARQKGGQLQQYVEIGDNQWALEKAPGYTLFQVPFQWLGIPRLANAVLAMGMLIVTFILLRRMRDEKTACIGSLLILYTPVSMILLNNAYFDSMAALAFLVMGGGLYIYYQLEKSNLRPWAARIILFLAFLLIGWSVVTRYTNFTVAAVFALHFVITRGAALIKKETPPLGIELPAVALGIALPLAVLLIYNYVVFGSVTDYGYHYTRFPIDFAFQYLGQVDQNGQSIPLTIIRDNLKAAPLPLLWGFPLLIIGLPALIAAVYFKFKPGKSDGRWSSLSSELPWDLLLVLIGWFVAVFALYLTYEFTAEYLGAGQNYLRFARFYLPGLFPIVVIGALAISRFRFSLYIPVVIAAVIAGSLIYSQYTLDQDSRTSSTERSERQNNHSQNEGSPRLTPASNRPAARP